MHHIWPIVNSQKCPNLCRRWNSWKWTVCPAKPAFNMSLKLPRKNAPKPSVVVQGRLRRYSDRMIASCKDLAAECAVSKILQNLYYISVQKKAGNSNQDLTHAATLLFRDVTLNQERANKISQIWVSPRNVLAGLPWKKDTRLSKDVVNFDGILRHHVATLKVWRISLYTFLSASVLVHLL